jgi:hypothetical protein
VTPGAIRHLEVSYADDGAVDRLTFKMLGRSENVAYVVTIEPNDNNRWPTEMVVRRRRFIGPSITDVEDVRLDPAIGYTSEAAAWEAIERLIQTDLAAST